MDLSTFKEIKDFSLNSNSTDDGKNSLDEFHPKNWYECTLDEVTEYFESQGIAYLAQIGHRIEGLRRLYNRHNDFGAKAKEFLENYQGKK